MTKGTSLTIPYEEEFEASEFASENNDDDIYDSVGESSQSSSSKPTPKPGIGAKENTAVVWSRVLVVFVLLAAAAGAGALTYIFTSASEVSEFMGDVSAF